MILLMMMAMVMTMTIRINNNGIHVINKQYNDDDDDHVVYEQQTLPRLTSTRYHSGRTMKMIVIND